MGRKIEANKRNCIYCEEYSKCYGRKDECQYIHHASDNTYKAVCVDLMVDDFREHTVPYPTRNLRKGVGARLTSGDTITPMYDYYAGLINDCLNDIRHGVTSYVYKLEHVKMLLRFEPSLTVTYNDGVYYLDLN